MTPVEKLHAVYYTGLALIAAAIFVAVSWLLGDLSGLAQALTLFGAGLACLVVALTPFGDRWIE